MDQQLTQQPEQQVSTEQEQSDQQRATNFDQPQAPWLQGVPEPPNPSWWQLMGKSITWLVTWFLVALVIFLFIMMLGRDKFMENAGPLLPFLLMLVAFICTLIGNAMMMGSYSLFFPERYYDFGKMFGFVLLANGLVFVLFLFIYFMGSTKDWSILMILAFHVLFSIFVAYNLIEFLPNPQYSWSSFVGNTLWFTLAIVIYLAIYNGTKNSADEGTIIYNLMIWPGVLGYTLLPLIQGIWQKVYYRFYEMGNNFFYLPTEQEIASNAALNDNQEINQDSGEGVNVET